MHTKTSSYFLLCAAAQAANPASGIRLHGNGDELGINTASFRPILTRGASSPTLSSPRTALGIKRTESPIKRTRSSFAGLCELGSVEEPDECMPSPTAHASPSSTLDKNAASSTFGKKDDADDSTNQTPLTLTRSSPTALMMSSLTALMRVITRTSERNDEESGTNDLSKLATQQQPQRPSLHLQKPGSKEWAQAEKFVPSVKTRWPGFHDLFPSLIERQRTFREFVREYEEESNDMQFRLDLGCDYGDTLTQAFSAAEVRKHFLALDAQDALLPPNDSFLDRYLRERNVVVKKYFRTHSQYFSTANEKNSDELVDELVGELVFTATRDLFVPKRRKSNFQSMWDPREHSIHVVLNGTQLGGADHTHGGMSISAFLNNVSGEAGAFLGDESAEEGHYVYRIVQKPLGWRAVAQEHRNQAYAWLEDNEQVNRGEPDTPTLPAIRYEASNNRLPRSKTIFKLLSTISVAGLLMVLLDAHGEPSQLVEINRRHPDGAEESHFLIVSKDEHGQLVLRVRVVTSETAIGEGETQESVPWESNLAEIDCYGTSLLELIPGFLTAFTQGVHNVWISSVPHFDDTDSHSEHSGSYGEDERRSSDDERWEPSGSDDAQESE